MKAPAFQFYPADFLADEHVALMSNQEIGCYIKLLCYCWREGSIPNDTDKLAKLCGENGGVMAQLWLAISSCFSQLPDDHTRLTNPRLSEERIKQENHKLERSESGKKGAISRWKKADGSAIQQPIAKPIAKPMAKNGSSSSSSLNKIYIGQVVDYLNHKAGKKFSAKSKPTIGHINARLSEGYTLEDFKRVIDTKVSQWIMDPAWQKYIRPETLFGAKFESYLNEKPASVQQGSSFLAKPFEVTQ